MEKWRDAKRMIAHEVCDGGYGDDDDGDAGRSADGAVLGQQRYPLILTKRLSRVSNLNQIWEK